MKLRNLIVRIIGVILITIILAITLLSIAYNTNKKYTYVVDDNFYKSNECYIDKNDYRVCEVKGEAIRIDMFYEED